MMTSGQPTQRALLVPILVAATTTVILVATANAQVPLSDLGEGTYLGYSGGLYDDGSNQPPPPLLGLAREAADKIVPRNAAGDPSALGAIAMISVGMSNANQEFRHFERSSDRAGRRNPSVVVVNTAVGGQVVEDWLDPIDPVWQVVAGRLAAAGVSRHQVQVVWLKLVHGRLPTTTFPDHAEVLAQDLGDLVTGLRDRFPNLALVYASNRTYGGYQVTNPDRDEPFSYQTGFGVKWMIANQPTSPGSGPVVLWGPDLWAHGDVARSDGHAWTRADVEGDGIHPSLSGELKIAALLSRFFDCEAPASDWWRSGQGASVRAFEVVADAHVDGARPGMNFGTHASLPIHPSPVQRCYLRFDLRDLEGVEVRYAKLSLMNEMAVDPGIEAWTTDGQEWSEATVTYDTAPGPGRRLTDLGHASRDGSLAGDLTEAVADATGGSLELILAASTPGSREVMSRESGFAPTLVVTVADDGSHRQAPRCGGSARRTEGRARPND